MKFDIQREQFLHLLQHVIGVVERRQTLPILANVLVAADDNIITMVATDLEVELSTRAELAVEQAGKTTLPARKLLDILRALPESASVSLSVDGDRAILKSGRSRFVLATLPADELPILENITPIRQIRMAQETLKSLIEHTHFAMAQQDVRYYLNGLLLEMNATRLYAVATDGHRLALCDRAIEQQVSTEDQQDAEQSASPHQIIVPRKGIQELLRLLDDGENEVELKISANHIHVDLGAIQFTSKLIDGRFPEYQRAIPQEGERVVVVDRQLLRSALARTSILANENRGVRMHLQEWLLRIQANNPEQEEAEEEVEISYSGAELEIGFNVTYLMDALGALSGEVVKLFFGDTGTSCLIREAEDDTSKYVISPMRL